VRVPVLLGVGVCVDVWDPVCVPVPVRVPVVDGVLVAVGVCDGVRVLVDV